MKKISFCLIAAVLVFECATVNAAHRNDWKGSHWKTKKGSPYLIRAKGEDWKRFHETQNDNGRLMNLLRSASRQQFLSAARFYAQKCSGRNEVLFNNAICVIDELAGHVVRRSDERKIIRNELKAMLKSANSNEVSQSDFIETKRRIFNQLKSGTYRLPQRLM